jgi:hypothetical protein
MVNKNSRRQSKRQSRSSRRQSKRQSRSSRRQSKRQSKRQSRSSRRRSRRRTQKAGSLASTRVMNFVNKRQNGGTYSLDDLENMTQLYKTTGGARKSKRSKRSKKSQRGGGSSDWRSTVYSRGPVNQPSNPDQFVMFTQAGNYISNEELYNQGLQ